jgi:signal recognition particle GTPase
LFKDDFGLETQRMNPTTIMVRDLRAEAAIEPNSVNTSMKTGEANKETQIIAIYGKGGIGKSFTLANLSYMRPKKRHHQSFVWRTGLPHDH